jgi:hypothetical protein
VFYIPKDDILHNLRRESLKSYILSYVGSLSFFISEQPRNLLQVEVVGILTINLF